jgi:hypothetical protein
MPAMSILRPARLAVDSPALAFEPRIEGLPDLAPIDWAAAGSTAPKLLDTPAGLPTADVVVIVWAEAEWAALHHVFCDSSSSMPYSARDESHFPGWQEDSAELIDGPADWTYWGNFRLVEVGATPVLLYKSNTHLDHPGAPALTALTQRLARIVKPQLIMSTGTAGGANATDHVGTVEIVKSATLYEPRKQPNEWPTSGGSWTAPSTKLGQAGFTGLLSAIPITADALSELVDQFNSHGGTSYTLSALDPLGLNSPDRTPAVRDLSGGATSLLTASSFLVGTTDNAYAAYACIEMDDAIVAAACEKAGVQYGSVRNLSDPAQNPALPSKKAGDWGSTIYRTYGIYTSLNGALAAWATIG